MQRTLDLLETNTITHLEIYKATDISPNWLWQFATGCISDPSVNRIEVLYNFLNGTPLEVK